MQKKVEPATSLLKVKTARCLRVRRGGCLPKLTVGITFLFSACGTAGVPAVGEGIGSWRSCADPESSGSAETTLAVIVGVPTAVDEVTAAL